MYANKNANGRNYPRPASELRPGDLVVKRQVYNEEFSLWDTSNVYQILDDNVQVFMNTLAWGTGDHSVYKLLDIDRQFVTYMMPHYLEEYLGFDHGNVVEAARYEDKWYRVSLYQGDDSRSGERDDLWYIVMTDAEEIGRGSRYVWTSSRKIANEVYKKIKEGKTRDLFAEHDFTGKPEKESYGSERKSLRTLLAMIQWEVDYSRRQLSELGAKRYDMDYDEWKEIETEKKKHHRRQIEGAIARLELMLFAEEDKELAEEAAKNRAKRKVERDIEKYLEDKYVFGRD